MAYQPIEEYGIIGNMHTAALVGLDASIDWLCFPHFDSPSVFAAILDDKKGGYFNISPTIEKYSQKQFYWPDTNVLITRFLSPDGVGEITDFMPVGINVDNHKKHQIIRRISVVRGAMTFRTECFPAFNYARDEHKMKLLEDGCLFRSADLSLALVSSMDLQCEKNGLCSEFTLEEGQRVTFVLQEVKDGADSVRPFDEKEIDELLRTTVTYWHNWLSKSTYQGRWREIIYRSALALKLLTFDPTGAMVAAPTCSLPTEIGGERNFDYRYTWIRDAVFTLYAFLRIGFTEEAQRFMEWLKDRCMELESGESLQIMYGLDGRRDISETILDHLEGYKGSKPVRVGNSNYGQVQLDIYGELMDSAYLYNKYGNPISYDLWAELRKLVDWVCENWKRKDKGIWEMRGPAQHFVFSKLMCWVALDRGTRLADKRSFPADRSRWLRNRDEIYEEIMTKGWSQEHQSFVQYYGSKNLDAANLMMPLVFFLSPTDPKLLKTIDAINQLPKKGGLVSDSLVYRYNVKEVEDGFKGREGTFNICTFWLIEALTRAGMYNPERLEQARFMFEKMLAYANHLGLYAEQTGFSSEALGNFPQAYTHLSLISAAYNLDRYLGEQ